MNKVRAFVVGLLLSAIVMSRTEPTLALDHLEVSPTSKPDSELVVGNAQIIDLSLADAVYLGLRDNRAIRGAYLQRITQKFDLRVAEDQFAPKLVLSGRSIAYHSQEGHDNTLEVIPASTLTTELGTRFSLAWTNQLDQANTSGQTRSSGVSLSVIQPLFRDAGEEFNTAPVRLARLTEQINRLSLKSTVSQTVTQIVRAYREFLRAQEQVRLAHDALERSRQLLEINKALITAGRMAAFEIIQTEADGAMQELGVEEANNQLATSRRELLRLLALDIGTVMQASDCLQAKHVTIDAAQAQQIALENQPEYLTQLIANEQAKINLKVAQNQRLSDVSLVGGGNYERHGFSETQGDIAARRWNGYVGVQVDIPIGDMSRQQGEVRAQVDVRSQVLRLKEARQLLEQSVGDAVRDVGTRWRQYEIAQRARDLSLKKLDFERQKLKVGRSSNFQVLSFESDLRNAESARLNVLLSYLNAQTQLDLQLGMTLESWQIAIND